MILPPKLVATLRFALAAGDTNDVAFESVAIIGTRDSLCRMGVEGPKLPAENPGHLPMAQPNCLCSCDCLSQLVKLRWTSTRAPSSQLNVRSRCSTLHAKHTALAAGLATNVEVVGELF